jgi:hypothetical protein
MANVSAGYNWVSGETVTPAKLNSAAAPTVVVADNEVTTAKILDANVTNAKLATGIDASKLTTGTLPIARIADGAITASKLDGAQTGSAPIYGCRAWVNFDGTRNATDTGASTNGANVLIRSSGNVTSVLKNGTGTYTITITTALPNSNYAVSGCCTFAAGTIGTINEDKANPTRTTTQIRVVTLNAQSITFYDSDSASVAIFG